MKQSVKFLSTALLSVALFSASAFAFPYADRSNPESSTWLPPQPKAIVAPEFAAEHDGATVNVRLTIDEAGMPHDVRVVSPRDRQLARCIVKAVSQWTFEPAIRDGKAIQTRVTIPIELVLDRNS